MSLLLLGAIGALTYRVRQLMQAVAVLQQRDYDRRMRYMRHHRIEHDHDSAAVS